MGIHGESGVQKLKLLPSRQAIDLALGQLFHGSRTLDIKRDDNVLLFVNNLGLFICLFVLELYSIYFQVVVQILN
jgi:dihydroxyacetone kinase